MSGSSLSSPRAPAGMAKDSVEREAARREDGSADVARPGSAAAGKRKRAPRGRGIWRLSPLACFRKGEEVDIEYSSNDSPEGPRTERGKLGGAGKVLPVREAEVDKVIETEMKKEGGTRSAEGEITPSAEEILASPHDPVGAPKPAAEPGIVGAGGASDVPAAAAVLISEPTAFAGSASAPMEAVTAGGGRTGDATRSMPTLDKDDTGIPVEPAKTVSFVGDVGDRTRVRGTEVGNESTGLAAHAVQPTGEVFDGMTPEPSSHGQSVAQEGDACGPQRASSMGFEPAFYKSFVEQVANEDVTPEFVSVVDIAFAKKPDTAVEHMITPITPEHELEQKMAAGSFRASSGEFKFEGQKPVQRSLAAELEEEVHAASSSVIPIELDAKPPRPTSAPPELGRDQKSGFSFASDSSWISARGQGEELPDFSADTPSAGVSTLVNKFESFIVSKKADPGR
ncbi:hypothetical protein FVE85_7571 [Porphyridium purpureum]|uniref:Uncharacterized protein n=1 Tax=Porphyridium purpureum TaxID=35688 RepID=A0A5J4Z898_PORPP|nr:hypothetical protein FVE85_7571 [Porphyridium purpureum]|eukprot:POR9161..scf295_1